MGDFYMQGWPFWRMVLFAIFILWLGHYLFSKNLEGVGKKSKRSIQITSEEQYQIEYKKLLAAVLHDFDSADKLIAFEYALAGPVGIGKVEAAKRALERLYKTRAS